MTNEELIAEILELQKDTAQQVNTLAKHHDGLTHAVDLLTADVQGLTKNVEELTKHLKRMERMAMRSTSELWARLLKLEADLPGTGELA